MPSQKDDIDKSLDPNILRFGMSRAQVKELENREKAKKKKLTKKWKPEGH